MLESQHPAHVRGQPSVLIVDDSQVFRLQVSEILRLEGFGIAGEAANGFEAIEMAVALKPDVILMDQNMPSLSGIEATRRIKAERPGQRVIFLAAEANWRATAIKAGADGYFVKGDDLGRLFDSMRSSTASSRRARQTHTAGPWWMGNVKLWLAFSGGVLALAWIAHLPALAPLAAMLAAGVVLRMPARLMAYAGVGPGRSAGISGRDDLPADGESAQKRAVLPPSPSNDGSLGVDRKQIALLTRPHISIRLPACSSYHECDRMISAWANLQYPNYEVVVPFMPSLGILESLRSDWGENRRVLFSGPQANGTKPPPVRVSMVLTGAEEKVVAEFDPEFIPPADVIERFALREGHHSPPSDKR